MATSNNSSVTLIAKGNIKPNRIAIGGGKGGVSNYELLTHKPSINGHELIGNKTNADLGIPTDTQDLTNTAGFITKIVDDLVNYYTKLEIDDIINEIKQSSFRIVDDLPLVGDPGVIYLILNATPQSRNYYDEYIYADNRWEKIGTTEIDLSGYVTDEELTQVLRSYITNEALNEALRNYYNKADVNLLLADKANSADLAAVATSGSYNDLQNKPDIPDDLADLNEDTTHRTVTDAEKTAWNNKSDFSGSYNDLTNKPTIPDELADLTDDTTHRLVTDAEKSTWNAKSDFSGSYNDLTNKPTIPDELADLSDDATHRLVTDTEKQIWNNKSDFSGSYNDLTDKPDIPTVYNSTITIQKNNQNIDSFTLNQSSNKSINMSVPEKTSDIQNDSGFITNTVNNLANYYLKSETYTKTEVSNLINAAVSGRFQKVNALPAQGEANVIYLVPKATILVDNVYDEYIWEDDSWELIGDTQIDLSGYVTDADLTAALQSYVTSATFNITISNYYTKTEIGILLADKVDKVDGKGLSTYDYDAAAKAVVDSTTANLANKVDKVEGKGLSTNDYTTTEKDKLAGIASGAEVNQNAFSNVKVGSTTIASGEKTATLELEAGSNITLTPDADNKKVVLSATDTTYSDATTSVHGLMSAADKTKLDDISDNAKKVESSSTNGHIEIDDVDTTVYDDTAVQTAIENIEDELSTDSATIEGNPLNFSTLSAQNAKSTIIDLEPIQDLHGFNKPWIGGAGKNILPMTVDGIKAANTSDNGTWSGNTYTSYYGITYTILTDSDNNITGIKVNGDSTAYFNFVLGNITTTGNEILNGTAQGSSGSSYRLDVYDATQSKQYVDLGSGVTIVDAGNYACRIVTPKNITVNNVIFYPMLRLSTVTDATFEPYTNIASISGRSEVDILGCGKNLLPKLEAGSHTSSGLTYTILEDGTIFFDGNKTSNAVVLLYLYGNESKLPTSDYYLSGSPAGGSDSTYKINWAYHSNDYGNGAVIPHTKGAAGQIRIQIASGYTTPANGLLFKPMLCFASDKSEFAPYQQSTDLTISFGTTVYGGRLNVESGELVVDRKCDVIEDSTNVQSLSTLTNTTRLIISTESQSDFSKANLAISNYLPYVENYTLDEPHFYMSSSGIIAFFPGVMTGDQWKTYIANNPLQVVYELATPQTIQLTPHTINLLKGVNNISTDGDKITLTYRNGKFATLDGAVPKMTFRGEDYTMGVDDIGLFLKNLTKSTKTYIANPLLDFDGTVATYKKIMKQWFINNGVNIMDSTGITYLCERWYEITKQGWKGGTSFPAVGVSTGSTGTRFDDNVGMSVTPSTDTSANTDTYQGLPLFAITDCNWELDSDGNILITAIDGITDNFVRNDPTKFVGVMQQTGWVKKVDDASTQKYYYADDKDAYEDLVPLPEAIKLDGTVRSFVVHAKYMSGIVDSKMTCCSGIIPRRNISHDGLVTLSDNIGTQYSGGTSVDWSFLVWMQRIKYASLTSDGVLQGCCNYNYQYYVKVSETGVKRLILSSANGANLKVGSTVTFGAYAGNADRGQAATYSISGQDGAIITAIEDVTIDSTTYKAVYVNTASTFDTVANGDATNGTTIVSTHHWVSGSCDNVKGNDGSPVSATNGVYPAKLQGIEYMVGGYEVFADVIMNISGGYYNPYYARKSTDQATSITSSMVQSTLKCAQPSSDAWRYIQKHGFDGEIFYPVSTGTSSSEYTKDGFYENGTGTTTGTREWLAFGGLLHGSGAAGVSCLTGHNGLGAGGWAFVARLSCNGNRGILLTA